MITLEARVAVDEADADLVPARVDIIKYSRRNFPRNLRVYYGSNSDFDKREKYVSTGILCEAYIRQNFKGIRWDDNTRRNLLSFMEKHKIKMSGDDEGDLRELKRWKRLLFFDLVISGELDRFVKEESERQASQGWREMYAGMCG